MNIPQDLTNLLFAVVPGLLVFLTAYFMIKRFLDNEQRMKYAELKSAMTKDLLPLRLQAYERIVLFLERISPNNLLNRVYEPGMSVIKRRYTVQHLFRRPGSYKVYFRLIRKGRELTAGSTGVQVQPGPNDFPE